MIICNTCNVEMEEEYFYKYNKKMCKCCFRIKSSLYYSLNKEKVRKYNDENKEKRKEYNKNYKENYVVDKEKLRKYTIEYKEREGVKERMKEYQKEYKSKYSEIDLEKNKKRDKEYAIEYRKREGVKERRSLLRKKRKNENNLYKITSNIRSLVGNAIRRKGYKKSAKTYEIIGCSYEELIIYLESKFDDWMSWDNYGKYNGKLNYGWDIDHIVPYTSAKTEDEIILLNHYTNLQPLCSKINRDIKKDRLDFLY